jgi:lysozyme family protein
VVFFSYKVNKKRERDMNFEKMMEFIFKWEGGYSNHPKDRGGETKYGIAKAFYPDLDIKNLTKEKATEIYLSDYYGRFNIGLIPEFIRLPFFDSTVNQGGHKASKLFQRAINLQATKHKFSSIKVDGKVGPITRAMSLKCSEHVLGLDFIRLRLDHYRSLSDFQYFGLGWENRIDDLISAMK